MNRTLSRCTVLAVLLLTPFTHAEAPRAVPLLVPAGHTTAIRLTKPQKIAIADPTVIDVLLEDPTHVTVVGLQPGESELNVWTKGGRHTWRVTVGPPDATSTPRVSTKIHSSRAQAEP